MAELKYIYFLWLNGIGWAKGVGESLVMVHRASDSQLAICSIDACSLVKKSGIVADVEHVPVEGVLKLILCNMENQIYAYSLDGHT